MTQPFEQTFHIRWFDLDANGHLANTSYLELAVDTRMAYFHNNGFPLSEFERLHTGPVVRRDTVDYFSELRVMDTVRVTLELAGLAPDGSRFRIRNVLYNAEGTVAAEVTSLGGWLNLETRRLMAPPEPLLEALRRLSKTDDFEELPSSLR